MKRMWLSILAGLLALPSFAGTYEIGAAMADEAFWSSDPVLFVGRHQENGFKFTSESRETADSRREGGVAYFGTPVYETRLNFTEKGIARVELTLFNRGGTEGLEEIDLGGGQTMRRLKRIDKEMSKDEFFKIVADVQKRLTPAGKRAPKTELQRMKNTDIRQYAQKWRTAQSPQTTLSATLTWNYEQGGKKTDPFKPGFIRIAIERTSAASKAAKGKPVKWTDNVVKETRGDVFIDHVPMVDQGQKGYCAAAASERVLRYYGIAVDEHEIAVAADTSADVGTTIPGMIRSMTAIGKRHRVSVTQLYGDTDKGTQERIRNLEKEVKAYNRAAKKLKKPTIGEDVYISRTARGVSYSPQAVEEAMDPEVRKELKVNGADRPKYAKFMRDVKQNVNAGTPLAWGVTLGIYPEMDLPQAKGGHMRLIIGYNEKKNEILYTDTWGKGHELKRMPAEWAWTITHALLAMKPM